MPENYTVSIVVPVRNRADLLARCLDSLLAQDYQPDKYEIVVCDDGSAVELSSLVENHSQGSPAIRLARQDSRGPAAARNLGIRRSSAPIILFIDSDVIADRALIRHLVTALSENPGWAGAEASLIPVEGAQSPVWEAPEAATGGRFHTAAIAYRREALIAAGGLDETFLLPACEDVELAARILPLGTIGFVPDAKAWHPRRKAGIRAHWRARHHWKYVGILAKRYGFLAFPERRIRRLSRLRVAWAAIAGLPLGRLLKALPCMRRSPVDAALASLYALFDIACGLCALPTILFCPIPERLDYLRSRTESAPSMNQALPSRTAVVVSAHRMYEALHACLLGFLKIVDRPEDLIFVDNGSSASLGSLICNAFPEITVINLSRNGLFCAGYNAGIRIALERNYDFVLIVNADTEVIHDAFIRDLVTAARQHPRAAFLGPLVYYRNRETVQNTRLRFPSIARQVSQWILSRLFPSLVHHPPLCEQEAEFLNGVCVLCRCAALREFGLMDEQYGGYVEDADWSWRARKRGWSSIFVPVPSIIHHEELEGYDHFSFKSYLLKRNTVRWFLKAGRRSSAFVYAFASICLAYIRMLRAQGDSARRQSRKFLRCLTKSYQTMLFRRLILHSDVAASDQEKGLEIWQ